MTKVNAQERFDEPLTESGLAQVRYYLTRRQGNRHRLQLVYLRRRSSNLLE